MNGKMIKLITVVLNFPTVIAVFIVYAKAIYMAMFSNPRFVALAPKVTVLNTDIDVLEAAQVGFKTDLGRFKHIDVGVKYCYLRSQSYESWITKHCHVNCLCIHNENSNYRRKVKHYGDQFNHFTIHNN